MTSVIVGPPHSYTDRGQPAIAASIEVEGRTHRIYYRASQGPLAETADPFLPIALLPAMALNVPLRVDGPLSPLLLARTSKIQDILASWWPADMHKVPITVNGPLQPLSNAGKRSGSFFTGGIDSSYTALKHTGEIDNLIFIYGYDVPLADSELRSLVARQLHQTAQEWNKPLIEVETNLRSLIDLYVDWNLRSHGAGLGCVALALAPQFRRIYIAATHGYYELRAHGSHPLLDPLWGTEALEVEHDGCELPRWRKAEQIITNPVVRRHLRVCYEDGRRAYNCGHCRGCLMVMIFLRATGMAGQCPTFPPLDDLKLVSSLPIESWAARSYIEGLLDVAERRQVDPALIEALHDCLKQADANGITSAWFWPEMRQAQGRIAALQTELNRLRYSSSWRLTAPLRRAASIARSQQRRLATWRKP
jgi:hypothetical protein